VFAYSRAGYGNSTPAKRPRPLDYMHVEALDVLPKLLGQDRLSPRPACSDIPTAPRSRRSMQAPVRITACRAVVLIAPHFIVEDISVALDRADPERLCDHGPEGETGALAQGCRQRLLWLERRLARSGLPQLDISEYLAYIRVPVAILQGVDDQYGTMRQVEIAQEECYCPVDVTVIPGAWTSAASRSTGAGRSMRFLNSQTRCCTPMTARRDGPRNAFSRCVCASGSRLSRFFWRRPDDRALRHRRSAAAAMGLCARSCPRNPVPITKRCRRSPLWCRPRFGG
jgi:hypothetical protein